MTLLNGILLAVAALIIGVLIGRFTVRSRDAGRLEQELKKGSQGAGELSGARSPPTSPTAPP